MWQTDASSSHSVATMLPSHFHVLLILLGISHDIISQLVRESEGRVGRRQWRARKEGGSNTTDNTTQVDTVPERIDLDKEVSPVLDGEGNFVGQAISLLQRLNERLTALQALDEQQIRRLESLEYRLTKIEVQGQEKYEALRTELREVSRRAQQLDWQSSKMDASLEGIKLDTTGLKHGQDQLRGLHGTAVRLPNLVDEDVQSKIHTLVASMYSVRGAIGVLQEDIADIKKNVSTLNNITSHTSSVSRQLLTIKHFTNAMLEMKEHTATPVASVLGSVSSRGEGDGIPRDCWELQEKGNNRSGIYRVLPPEASRPFFVYCQQDKRGGGWTVIQNRFEGTVDFYRGWQDYKHGFGNIGGEFWLGLEKLHLLTNYKVNELFIELQDFTLEKSHAQYSAFAVGSEIEGYPISVLGKYEGTAGDSLVYHAGMRFSAHDMDHDGWEDGNCAHSHKGAWWYNGCDTSNLNGQYLNGEVPENYEYQGMYWYDWRGPSYSLMKSRISVRPRSQVYTVTESSGRTKLGDKHHLEEHKRALNLKQEAPNKSQHAE